ncbi:MAG: aminodeoxychorismate synthase component I, partial [Gammaproteobacteria bacterium]|nr:aminodeoxychorismate synthase component I [Gammaproteobacteria bacterium]
MFFEYPLPYHSSSTPLFAAIRQRTRAVFLQSAAQSAGRYDIISADPTLMIVADAEKTLLIQEDRTEVLSQDPIDYLIAQLPPQLPQSPYPFIGGILGYCAYDWGLALQGIQRRIKPHHPLPLLHLGLYDWALIS